MQGNIFDLYYYHGPVILLIILIAASAGMIVGGIVGRHTSVRSETLGAIGLAIAAALFVGAVAT